MSQCQAALSLSLETADAIATHQHALTSVEMDWIRQFWSLGTRHAGQHCAWWLPQITLLEDMHARLMQQVRKLNVCV